MASPEKPSWTNRRKVIFETLYADHFVLAFVLVATVILSLTGHQDAYTTSILFAAMIAAFIRSVMVIGSYVFGAAWDDRNFMLAVTGKMHPGAPAEHEPEPEKG